MSLAMVYGGEVGSAMLALSGIEEKVKVSGSSVLPNCPGLLVATSACS